MTTPGTDHFSSPLSGRSFINPVTNISIISSFSASTHLPRLVKRTMPTDVLPAFLHEATHHWCFLTTVGGALTLLHQRALADAAKYDTSTPDRHKVRRLSSSMARFEAFMALQRPLAEGLALFAEFDLRSGGTLPSLCHVLARVAD